MTARRLHALAQHCWSADSVITKLDGLRELQAALGETNWQRDETIKVLEQSEEPGRPAYPELVDNRNLATRGLGTEQGRIAFFHALAHIEFTAINLALDAACRFDGLPNEYYLDWLGVACEEGMHFGLLQNHLSHFGAHYGQLQAHGGLWDVAADTSHDVLLRMALVPRVLEARGLDVTPAMIEKLRQVSDSDGARILERILTDEIGHVAIGSRWYNYLCEQRKLRPVSTFIGIVKSHFKGSVRGPFNQEARLAAGFTNEEIHQLDKI